MGTDSKVSQQSYGTQRRDRAIGVLIRQSDRELCGIQGMDLGILFPIQKLLSGCHPRKQMKQSKSMRFRSIFHSRRYRDGYIIVLNLHIGCVISGISVIMK